MFHAAPPTTGPEGDQTTRVRHDRLDAKLSFQSGFRRHTQV